VWPAAASSFSEGELHCWAGQGKRQVRAELKGSDDYFGGSVAISGTTAVVGAEGHASDAGRAYVFTKTAASWKQVAELKGSDTVADDDFGNSVAISGTTAVVGAPNHPTYAGRACSRPEARAGSPGSGSSWLMRATRKVPQPKRG